MVLFILYLMLVSVKVRSHNGMKHDGKHNGKESKQMGHYNDVKKPHIWTVVDCNTLDGSDGSRRPMECSGANFQACLRGDSSEDDGILKILKCTNSSGCRNINCEDGEGSNLPQTNCVYTSERWGPCVETEDGGGEGGGCLGCRKGYRPHDKDTASRKFGSCKKDQECCQRCVKVSFRTDTSSTSGIGHEDWFRKLGVIFVYFVCGILIFILIY